MPRWMKAVVGLSLVTFCVVMMSWTVSRAEEIWYTDGNGKRVEGEPPASVIAPHLEDASKNPGPEGYYAHGHGHPHVHPHKSGGHHHHPHPHPHFPGKVHHHPVAGDSGNPEKK